MLELRPGCERCDRDLPADSTDALICSFECTFCSNCNDKHFNNTCPNCGGGLVSRPTRTKELLEKYPASTKRVFKGNNTQTA